ncbi:MAG: IS21 family transposase [Pseudomonadota bacterium]
MISMVDKQKIIHSWHVEKKSELEISKELNLSRNTVRRYLKAFRFALEQSLMSGEPQPVLEEFLLGIPRYNSVNRGKRKLNTEIISAIDAYLQENQKKRLIGKRKQVLKKIDIWELLQSSGHDIGYTVVCDYIRMKESVNQEAFIRQEYEPGENCEFDWCEIRLTINGIDRKLYLAIFTMCKSNFRFSMIFQRQDTLAFMEAHIAFFSFLGGVSLRMNYDNMRVAIAEFVGSHQKKPTVALLQLSSFYGFRFRFCNIFCGHEKGHVERSVEYIRRKAFARKDEFTTICEAQNYLDDVCVGLNSKKLTGSKFTIDELISEEREHLLAYPGRMECFTLEQAGVDKYATFVLGRSHYSVPDHLVGQTVEVKVFSNQLKIYYQGQALCSHARSSETGDWIITLDHYLRTLQRKPGSLHGSVAIKQAPWEVQEIYESSFRDKARDFIELLQYCKKHEVSHVRLWEVYRQLQGICPSDISLDKLKALLGNNPDLIGIKYPDSDIVRFSREQLVEIHQILEKN